MATTEIRITGFGGQGVILCGYVIGKAASIFNDQYATLTQSFGPEARGSACSAQVVVSDERVLYPYATASGILLAMSKDGYGMFKNSMNDDSILIYEKELVPLSKNEIKGKAYGIPATRIAEELGRKIVLNIVMLGFFGAITNLVPIDALRKAVESSVPEGTEELNLRAFDRGYEFGVQLLENPDSKTRKKAAVSGSSDTGG